MVQLHEARIAGKQYECMANKEFHMQCIEFEIYLNHLEKLLSDQLYKSSAQGRNWGYICQLSVYWWVESDPLRSSCQVEIKCARELSGEIFMREKKKGREIL